MGLQDYLKCELMLAKPDSYVTAVSLAKLHEQKHAAIQQVQRQSQSKGFSSVEGRGTSYSPTNTKPIGFRTAAVTPRTTMSQGSSYSVQQHTSAGGGSPFKRLTAAEIKQKREKGLCYYCEEKYNPSHRCKTSYLLLVGEEEMSELLRGWIHHKGKNEPL